MCSSLKKAVIATMAVALVEFISSLFIYDSDVQVVIVLITFLLCFLTALCSLVFLCVRKWRRKLYVTVPILICGILTPIIYCGIEIHITKNPDRVALREARQWIAEHAANDGEFAYYEDMLVEPYESMDIIGYTSDENKNYVFSCQRKNYTDTSYVFVSVGGEWNQYASVQNVKNICSLPVYDDTMVELYKKIKEWKYPEEVCEVEYDDDYPKMCSEYKDLISDMRCRVVQDINKKTTVSSFYTEGVRHEYSLAYDNRTNLKMTDLKFVVHHTRTVNGVSEYDFYNVKDTKWYISPRTHKSFSFEVDSKNAGPGKYLLYVMPSEIYDDDWVEAYLQQSFDWEKTEYKDYISDILVSKGHWENNDDFFESLLDSDGKYNPVRLSSYMVQMFKDKE